MKANKWHSDRRVRPHVGKIIFMRHRRALFPLAHGPAWLISVVLLQAVAGAAQHDSKLGEQPPPPVAAYEVPAQDALKDDFGVQFQWALAPDNSILVSFGKLDGQWEVEKITGWETQMPKVQTVTFPFHKPGRYHLSGQPIIAPNGDYAVVQPGYHKKNGTSGAAQWEDEIAVIDLRTFRLSSLVQHDSDNGSDFLYFDNNGILMLRRALTITALSLPELKPIASCSLETAQEDQKGNSSCATLLSMTHVSSFRELERNHLANPRWSVALGGQDCTCEARNKKGNLELDRCGKVHFAASDGVFSTTFWHALKVLSVPQGKTVFSLRLHVYEGTASGLFAHVDDQNYLIVRRGLKLTTYRLPK